MPKKLILPRYEKMILDIGQMDADELENIIRCAKAMLAMVKPRVPRKVKAKVQEKTA